MIDVPLDMQQSDLFYPVLGFILGQEAGEKIPVVEGITAEPEEDQLKALGAAAASAGGVALFHLIGITPEAPTVEKAFQGGHPEQIIDLNQDKLRAAYWQLSTAENTELDLVALGCPHFSIAEFEKLTKLISGKRKHPNVRFLVTTNRWVMNQAQQKGYIDKLESFGAELSVDACILTSPMLPKNIKTIMTNSGKYAYYTPGLLDRKIHFASIEDCVRSAIEGFVIRENELWR
jgi:predicted aconitase